MVQPKKEYYNIETYTIPRYFIDYRYKLDANENPLGCSVKVLEAIANTPGIMLSRYPTFGELEEAIAEFNQVAPEKIIITNGSDSALKAVYNTYINSDTEVLFATPTFIMYDICSQRVNGKVVTVPYEEKWVYPTDKLIEKINDKTKLIVICSPNNPTGDLVPEEDICRILEAAPHAIVLIDEAYYRFCDRPQQSLKHLIDRYPNIVIMHTFSKDFGLAGLRLGYMISNPENLNHIRKATDPFHVNMLAVIAGVAAIKDQDFVNDYLQNVKDSKEYTTKTLKEMGFKVYDTEANFLLFEVGNRQEWLHSKFLKKNIKLRRYPRNPQLYGYIRLTLCPVEDMKIILPLFRDYEALVFDIDGVLVDVRESYRIAIQKTYEFFAKKPITQEDIQNVKNQGGLNNDWMLTHHLLKINNVDVPFDEMVNKFQELYFDDGKGLINKEKLLIDVDLIKSLAKKFKLAIFTGRPGAEAEFILKKFGIYDCFKAFMTMEDCPDDKSKPHPYGLEVIMDKLNTKNIVYFGDTVDDMISGTMAHVDPAGILPPQDKSDYLKKRLIDNGAVEVYNNIEDAIKYILDIEK